MRWGALVLWSLVAAGCGRGSAERAPAAADPLPARLQVEVAWATYWGAPGGAALRTALFDPDGNLYIAGGTQAAPQWPRSAPPIGPLGDFDVIVAKFDAQGRSVWSLLIGGPGEDYAYVSALDHAGNLVVGGRSGPGFPVTPGAYDTAFAGGTGEGPHRPTDGFLLSLTPGGALRWATYLGSSGDDVVRAIEILPDGGIAVAGGNTTRGDLPTTAGVVKPALGGGKDASVSVIEPDGASARFVTYFGPSDDEGKKGDETLRAIGLAPDGSLWLGGTTKGTDLAATPDAFQPARNAGPSAFIAKLTPDGRRIPYFSWLGGSGSDEVETEGTQDASGAFLAAGVTSSADFPVTPGAFAGGSGPDGWIARISPAGALEMAARIGGSGEDSLFGPALDDAGFLYGGGATSSADLPVTQGAPQARFAGGEWDGWIAGVDPSGALAFASYWGGSEADVARFVATDRARRRVALIGETRSADLPLKAAAQSSPGGAFVAVFAVGPAAPAAAAAGAERP